MPAVAAPVLEGRADFSVGSRNVGAGGVGFEWSAVRRAISAGATALALPLTKSTDPMSGFFCTTKKALARGTQRGPRGDRSPVVREGRGETAGRPGTRGARIGPTGPDAAATRRRPKRGNRRPRPVGFKIGLEIMVRCDCSRVVDVPITFREREAGESKLSAKQNVEYFRRADLPKTGRGDAAAATWIFCEMSRRDAAAATWIFGRGKSHASGT